MGKGPDRKIMARKPEESMNKYLVKALVAKEGKPASLRFVPLEIFDLWKSHMQSAYHYRVSAVEVSLWISADPTESELVLAGSRGERIIEVRLSKKIGTVAMPVERYFLEEDMMRLLPTFLAHYGIDSSNADAMARVHFQRGYFVQPEEVFQDEF
jgi:hypothetical protein